MIGVGGEHGQTAGRSPEGPAPAGARSDHRPGPSAGAAGGRDRLGFPRWALQLGVPAGPGQPGLPTRLVAGLFILKHMHNLSDEVLCARWIENPYYQYFCGELSFCHQLPFDRSSLTRWRQRLGEEQLVALLQESLSVAHKTGALETKDLERVAVDTTVQPKAIAHPTDARLMHRALEKLVALAQRSRRAAAPELPARGQARRHHGRALHPRPSVQARPQGAQVPAHPARPRHPRHQPQDRWPSRARGPLRPAARSRHQGAPPGPPSARPQGLFAPRARGRVHRQGQGPSALRVRLQGERSPRP